MGREEQGNFRKSWQLSPMADPGPLWVPAFLHLLILSRPGLGVSWVLGIKDLCSKPCCLRSYAGRGSLFPVPCNCKIPAWNALWNDIIQAWVGGCRDGWWWQGEKKLRCVWLSLPWTLPRYHLEVGDQKDLWTCSLAPSPCHWVVCREGWWKQCSRLDKLLSPGLDVLRHVEWGALTVTI